jgi:hypothetical protein
MRGERHLQAAHGGVLREEEEEMASTPQPSDLVRAISAALVNQGVPVGSLVDVANGPAEGLGFTVHGDADDES